MITQTPFKWLVSATALAVLSAVPGHAQTQLITENPAVPAEPSPQAPSAPVYATPTAQTGQMVQNPDGTYSTVGGQSDSQTYEMGEIIAAADGAFGKATEGLAKVIEKIFADLGRPNAYITGREGGGALIVGLRYGKGTLYSKIEGERTVHWNGPSIGPDVGGDASRSFVLVYNLHDTEEIYQRFPAIEGKAYLIGGISVNYHQRGNLVLVPIRLGAGWRLGANVGYLKYTKKGRILPF